MMNKRFKPAVAAVMTGAILAGTAVCPMTTFAADAVDLNSMTLDDITAKAKEEGDVESVGMPDSWANWGLTWQDLNDKYGITHADSDMSSAEELQMFRQKAKKEQRTSAMSDRHLVHRQWMKIWYRDTKLPTGIAFRIGQKAKTENG